MTAKTFNTSNTIVLDIGSANFYVGPANIIEPHSGPTLIGQTTKFQHILPTAASGTNHPSVANSNSNNNTNKDATAATPIEEFYYGNQIENRGFLPGLLYMSHPVRRSNWLVNDGSLHENQMEHFVDYLLNDEVYHENCDPMLPTVEDCAFILPEPSLHAHKNIEDKATIMFETFQIPYLLVENSNWLTLLSYGKQTGIVVQSGAGVTQVSPFFEFSNLRYHEQSYDFGGVDVTDITLRLLNNSDLLERYRFGPKSDPTELCYKYKFSNSVADKMIINDIKENYGSVPIESIVKNKYKSVKDCKTVKYELPDGYQIDLYDTDLQLIGESMFQPEVVAGREVPGIHEIIFDVVQNCPIDVRRDLLNSIMLGGGATKIKGFDARLHNELSTLATSSMDVNIVSDQNNNRSHMVFRGACALAGLSIFSRLGVDRATYEEEGPIRVVDAFTNWHY